MNKYSVIGHYIDIVKSTFSGYFYINENGTFTGEIEEPSFSEKVIRSVFPGYDYKIPLSETEMFSIKGEFKRSGNIVRLEFVKSTMIILDKVHSLERKGIYEMDGDDMDLSGVYEGHWKFVRDEFNIRDEKDRRVHLNLSIFS